MADPIENGANSTDEYRSTLSPEQHYEAAMKYMRAAESSVDWQPSLGKAIAHALLGGLRDGLDYAARQATFPEVGSPLLPGPAFEEDVDRP
jgi:hypothetical protein